MSKPWEETWRTNPFDGREVECPDPALPDDDAYRIAEVYMGSEDGTAARFSRAKFISAAPDMARALLEFFVDKRTGHLKTCGGACDPDCEAVRAALAKAGVLP